MRINERYTITALLYLYSSPKQMSLFEFDQNGIHALKLPMMPGELLRHLIDRKYIEFVPDDPSFAMKREILLLDEGINKVKPYFDECANYSVGVIEQINGFFLSKDLAIKDEYLHLPFYSILVQDRRIKFQFEYIDSLLHLSIKFVKIVKGQPMGISTFTLPAQFMDQYNDTLTVILTSIIEAIAQDD